MRATPVRRATKPLARGSRVVLRAVTAADRDELVAMNRASRSLHHPWMAPPDTRAAFTRWAARIAGPDFAGLAICHREDGAIVGVVNVSHIVRGLLRSAYLGYYANAAFARQGLMAEGLMLAVRYCFGPLRLHRVEANIQPGNHASRRLVERLGFTREGTSRRYLKINGRWRDHERWALLKEDVPRPGRSRGDGPRAAKARR